MLTTLALFSWLLPKPASTFAPDVDWLYFFNIWMSLFFVVLIAGLMVFFAFKYRQKNRDYVAHGANHNNLLEVTWSIIPMIMVLIIFVWGFDGFIDMTTPPGGSYQITVEAHQWAWKFEYPEGATSTVLHVPADRPVRFVLDSTDVIHSMYIPAFRIKKDVVPGRYNKTWFHAKFFPKDAKTVKYQIPGAPKPEIWKNVNVYPLYCAEYCGTGHSQMHTKVVVHKDTASFEKWLKEAGTPKGNPVQKGQQLYTKRGCVQCHSVDGSPGTGPTWKNLFGSKVTLANGQTVTANEKYIRHSVEAPGDQVVKNFANVMPTMNLSTDEINWIIAYQKSISKHYHGSLDSLKGAGKTKNGKPQSRSQTQSKKSESPKVDNSVKK